MFPIPSCTACQSCSKRDLPATKPLVQGWSLVKMTHVVGKSQGETCVKNTSPDAITRYPSSLRTNRVLAASSEYLLGYSLDFRADGDAKTPTLNQTRQGVGQPIYSTRETNKHRHPLLLAHCWQANTA